MASGRKLGIFWGANAFSVIESNQDAPVKTFRVPFNPSSLSEPSPPTTINTDDIRLVSILKEALNVNKVGVTDVHLALPSKDIVIRSFVIPLLKPNEIKGVVEFEIKKYIPFNLKELAYSFHASPLIEDKVKRMRVHFVAIRREILEHYSSILKQSGLNVIFSEPAPMCLARALITKKYVKPDQKVAIVQTDYYDSRIIVFDSGVVQFVRDFQLHSPALNTPPPDPELLKKKLFNEIKISLDFYMRQFKSEKISEVLAISFDPTQDLVAQLQQELEMPVRTVDPHTIVNSPNAMDIGAINAFGSVLTPHAKTALFNLSGSTTVTKSNIPSGIQIPEEYLPAVKVGVICVLLVLGTLFFTKFHVAQTKKQYDRLVEEQGPFIDMSLETIQQRVDDNNNKLETLKNIFRPTEMSLFLVRIPKLLPDGVWLTELNLQYLDIAEKTPEGASAANIPSKAATGAVALSLDVAGYAYMLDANQQFKVVYSFIGALKSDNLLKKYLKNVNLSSPIQSEQHEKDTVTSFRINGK
jgi:Tfp pilus assembly PilM family ATPase